jgi:hypothetical protein
MTRRGTQHRGHQTAPHRVLLPVGSKREHLGEAEILYARMRPHGWSRWCIAATLHLRVGLQRPPGPGTDPVKRGRAFGLVSFLQLLLPPGARSAGPAPRPAPSRPAAVRAVSVLRGAGDVALRSRDDLAREPLAGIFEGRATGRRRQIASAPYNTATPREATQPILHPRVGPEHLQRALL